MSTETETRKVPAAAASSAAHEAPSFAETALRLGGKGEDEVRRMGTVDRADEQVETMYAERRRTEGSPVHRAVWDDHVPLELFGAPELPASAPCDAAMQRSLEVVRKRKDAGTLYSENGKLSDEVIHELGPAGFWGMLIGTEFGGQAAPFTRFAQFHTQLSVLDGTTAGMGSVHGCIGAVDPLNTFGTPDQKQRFLPRLASGQAISAFALTEPGAGSDLTALKTTATDAGDDFEITGEKLFITNVVPGRTIALVAMLKGRPAVLIADLPPQETEQFQIVKYGLHALRHTYNQGLRFNKFRVPKENLLVPPVGDGLTIAYHGLNLGRITLCAGAAGTMRVILANLLPWAHYRRTYGQLIETRELVKRRIARLAGLIAGADALVAWSSWLIDEGYRGELECIVAKIFGSEALKEASIELLMKTHGGRSFLHGHLFGDNIHDYLAPSIYEGEGEMLAMAFFKSLVKEHGRKYFEPIGKALQQHGMKTLNPANPMHVWKLRKELTSYAKWSVHQKLSSRGGGTRAVSDPRLAAHIDFAIASFRRHRADLSGIMRKHQLKLADRQLRIAEVSRRVQNTVVMLVTAQWAAKKKGEAVIAAADILCQDLRRELTGERPSDRYFKDVSKLADLIMAGGYEALTGVKPDEILMQYEQK